MSEKTARKSRAAAKSSAAPAEAVPRVEPAIDLLSFIEPVSRAVAQRIMTEHAAAHAAGRRSSINPDDLPPQRDAIRIALDVGPYLAKTAPAYLPAYLQMFKLVFDRVEAARLRVAGAIPSARKFSGVTRAFVETTGFPKFKDIRDIANDRLLWIPGSGDLRALLGVNSSINADQPQEVLEGLTLQRDTCRDPKWVPMLENAEMFPSVWAAELDPLVKFLGDSIHEGVTNETVRAEANAELQSMVLLLDITLSRAASFVTLFAGRAHADKLNAAVPRKHQRGGAVETAPGQGGQGAQGGQGGQAAPAATPAVPAVPAVPHAQGEATAAAGAGEMTKTEG